MTEKSTIAKATNDGDYFDDDDDDDVVHFNKLNTRNSKCVSFKWPILAQKQAFCEFPEAMMQA